MQERVCSHAFEAAENEFKQKQINNIHSGTVNQRSWWQTVKTFISWNNGNTTNNSTEKANLLNKSFLNYSTIDTSNATIPETEYLTNERLDNLILSEDKVSNILKSLKVSKASGPDGISPRMLKMTATSITKPMTRLFNKSLRDNIFPDIWKRANVSPIFKKGDPHLCDNYRPVSLLSVVGKCLEKCGLKYLFNHIRDNDLLSKFQSGFQPGDGTVRQLVHIYHILSRALDEKKKVRIVFSDISKAFDRVWHQGLLHKLVCAGITGNINNWFSSYLSNRLQRVVVKGEYSSWGTVTAGLPQGSVLGPILFLIYINDITKNLTSGISLFADDNMIYISSNNSAKNDEILSADLKIMEEWANQWLVTFSPSKSWDMTLALRGSPESQNLIFFDEPISQVKHHKHLCIVIQ